MSFVIISVLPDDTLGSENAIRGHKTLTEELGLGAQ